MEAAPHTRGLCLDVVCFHQSIPLWTAIRPKWGVGGGGVTSFRFGAWQVFHSEITHQL